MIFLSVAPPLALAMWVRRSKNAVLGKGIAYVLGTLLTANKLAQLIYGHTHGTLSWRDSLPMHLCDWAVIAAVITLFTRWQKPYELLYFWGLAGCFQAILTPDLPYAFPHFYFITFFVSHCGILWGVLFATLGLGLRPHMRSVAHAWGWSQVYLVCAILVNWLLGSNYGYVCAKPIGGSLLDYFGPWPWYIGVMETVAFISFGIYYLPFWLLDRRAKNG